MVEQLTSPLAEANPASLEEFFSRDPEAMSDQEIELMVKHLREVRVKWNQAEQVKLAKGKGVPKGVPLDKEAMDDLLKGF